MDESSGKGDHDNPEPVDVNAAPATEPITQELDEDHDSEGSAEHVQTPEAWRNDPYYCRLRSLSTFFRQPMPYAFPQPPHRVLRLRVERIAVGHHREGDQPTSDDEHDDDDDDEQEPSGGPGNDHDDSISSLSSSTDESGSLIYGIHGEPINVNPDNIIRVDPPDDSDDESVHDGHDAMSIGSLSTAATEGDGRGAMISYVDTDSEHESVESTCSLHDTPCKRMRC